jgi:hypothetical protein
MGCDNSRYQRRNRTRPDNVSSNLATMTTNQYLAALKKLGLTPASKATAATLGLSVRQCQRFAAGAPIPETIAILLRLMLSQPKRN